MNCLNRKILLFLILLCIISVVSYAHLELSEFKLSAGGGLYFSGDFGGGYQSAGKNGGYENFMKTPQFGIGLHGFFDLHYIELNLGLFGSCGNWESYASGGHWHYKVFVYGSGLDIGIFLKYPFVLNDRFSSFPLLGCNYRALFTLFSEDERKFNTDDSSSFDALWFKFGYGLDYSFKSNKYLRTELFYGFRYYNKCEEKNADSLETIYRGHGPEIKISIGFKF